LGAYCSSTALTSVQIVLHIVTNEPSVLETFSPEPGVCLLWTALSSLGLNNSLSTQAGGVQADTGYQTIAKLVRDRRLATRRLAETCDVILQRSQLLYACRTFTANVCCCSRFSS
jgi:hypothetical protein